jgi:hypothetical protein
MGIPVLLEASRRSFPITIKTRLVQFDEKLKQVICANVRSGLGRFFHGIRSVFVWVEDANGPRDGSGIRCRMLVSLTPGGRLSVSADSASAYAAVADCASHARTLVDRFLKRRRTLKRRAREVR